MSDTGEMGDVGAVSAAPAADTGVEQSSPAATTADDGLLMPDGQRLFDREYVTKIRDEAANYRTQLREMEARANRYEVLDGYDDDDRSVWLDLASTWQQDPFQAAAAMRDIASRVLGEAETQQIEQDTLDAIDESDEWVTPEKVQQIVAAELQRQAAAQEMESMVQDIYGEMRTAGVDPNTLDGYMVLWRASNETGGDVQKAIEAHNGYRQSIIDGYVQSKTAGGGAAPPPNGTTGVQRQEPKNLDDAFAAAREFLKNSNTFG
jgi:hypothetical protein